MDPNFNSTELTTPKTEVDVDNDVAKVYWTSENTMKLIELFEKECKELWDTKNALYKDRPARQAKLEYLANVFGTNSEEISRKLHNLRTQFNNELRKIKKRAADGETSAAGSSGWEYFDSLLFLMREPIADNGESMDGINLALAEFQADEEDRITAARARLFVDMVRTLGEKLADKPASSPKLRRPIRAASCTSNSPLSALPMLWNEEPRLSCINEPDDCKIFGDFVASELRSLQSLEARYKLKRTILKAVLQATEEQDVSRHNRFLTMDSDPLN